MTKSNNWGILVTILALAGCTDNEHDCNYLANCGPFPGGGTGTAGSGAGGITAVGTGTGGSANVGGSAGGSNSGGSNSGGISSSGAHTGGMGTGGVTSACGQVCSGTKPVCNESAESCVECVGDGNCSGVRPACETTSNTCVQCTKDSYCSGATPACKTANDADSGTDTNTCVQCTKDSHCSGKTSLCDTTKSLCVQCKSNTDCSQAEAPLCSSGTCSPCTQDTDCTHISGKTVCNTASSTNSDAGTETDAGSGTNTCVQCTGTKYTACEGDAGTTQVCDSLNNTCTNKAEHSADLCQPCVSDAQCKPGELCVEQKVNGNSLGYFCLWKQGDTAHNAPADCTATGRPYFSAIVATSIDGEDAAICSLRASTCTAMNQYSQTSCASSPGTPDNSKCGFAPGVDSECASIGSQYRCTVACLSDDDCPPGGITPITCSVTSGAHKYCSL